MPLWCDSRACRVDASSRPCDLLLPRLPGLCSQSRFARTDARRPRRHRHRGHFPALRPLHPRQGATPLHIAEPQGPVSLVRRMLPHADRQHAARPETLARHTEVDVVRRFKADGRFAARSGPSSSAPKRIGTGHSGSTLPVAEVATWSAEGRRLGTAQRCCVQGSPQIARTKACHLVAAP